MSAAPRELAGRGAAIVLAAGASSRMGGVPKATLDVGGESALARVVRLARDTGFAPTIVVVGASAAVVGAEATGLGASVAENPAWPSGRTGSLQVGLRSAPTDRPFLVWPVDHPFVRRDTVELICRRAAADPLAVWALPTYDGRGGHPVLLAPRVRGPVLDLSPAAPLRSLIPGFGPQVVRVAVSDPGVVENVDTPEQYAAARSRRKEDGWTDG